MEANEYMLTDDTPLAELAVEMAREAATGLCVDRLATFLGADILSGQADGLELTVCIIPEAGADRFAEDCIGWVMHTCAAPATSTLRDLHPLHLADEPVFVIALADHPVRVFIGMGDNAAGLEKLCNMYNDPDRGMEPYNVIADRYFG